MIIELVESRSTIVTKPGVVASREIRKYQKSTDLLIRKMLFQWLISKITQKMATTLLFAADSIAGLHEAAEVYLVSLREDENVWAIHTKRVTVMPEDI